MRYALDIFKIRNASADNAVHATLCTVCTRMFCSMCGVYTYLESLSKTAVKFDCHDKKHI